MVHQSEIQSKAKITKRMLYKNRRKLFITIYIMLCRATWIHSHPNNFLVITVQRRGESMLCVTAIDVFNVPTGDCVVCNAHLPNHDVGGSLEFCLRALSSAFLAESFKIAFKIKIRNGKCPYQSPASPHSGNCTDNSNLN